MSCSEGSCLVTELCKPSRVGVRGQGCWWDADSAALWLVGEAGGVAGSCPGLFSRCGMCAERHVASVLTCETGLVMATARRCWPGWNEVVGQAGSRRSSPGSSQLFTASCTWDVGPRAWAQEPKPSVAISRA